MNINPYILFPGNCEEAVNFYREALSGEITHMSRFDNAPVMDPAHAMSPEKIMHAELKVGEAAIMFSDGPANTITEGNNVQISLNFSEPDVLDNRFGKMSVGGKVTMVPQTTFWGARFAMLTDRFGISWMFNCDLKPPAPGQEGMSNIDIIIK